MQKQKKSGMQQPGTGLGREPDSRVRIKPQTVDRDELVDMVAAKFQAATREAVQELAVEADHNGWSHEEFVDRLLALTLDSVKGFVSEQDRPYIERHLRKVLLSDPRYR